MLSVFEGGEEETVTSRGYTFDCSILACQWATLHSLSIQNYYEMQHRAPGWPTKYGGAQMAANWEQYSNNGLLGFYQYKIIN